MTHTSLHTADAPPSFNRSRWLLSGSTASLLSMAVLAWHGRRRIGSSTALINAPSHWLHGDRALRANSASFRFTLPGALIHHASSLLWGLAYEGVLRALQKKPASAKGASPDVTATQDKLPSALKTIASASAVTTLAWVVDTRLVPRRLTPGFERRSSRTGMLLIYGSFAAGLALGALAQQRPTSNADLPKRSAHP